MASTTEVGNARETMGTLLGFKVYSGGNGTFHCIIGVMQDAVK